jgi:hypothetical protein
MRSISYGMVFLILFSIIAMNCQSSGNPCYSSQNGDKMAENPGEVRTVESFAEADMRQIFGTTGEFPNAAYHSVDTAVLINTPTMVPALIPTEVDPGGDMTYTAFVSLERQAIDTFVPVCRWVSEGGGQSAETISVYVPELLHLPEGQHEHLCYNFPKCDAAFTEVVIDGDTYQYAELAVCYMWRDGVPLFEQDWDIGVTQVRWRSQPNEPLTYDDLNAQPLEREAHEWDDDGSGGNAECFPDIAYDLRSGDMYLVYSEFMGSVPDWWASVYLKYRHYHRSILPPFDPWSQEYWCKWHRMEFSSEGNAAAHGALMPRIDVGLVDWAWPANLPAETNAVVIAYVSQNHASNTFHPHVYYWATAEADGNKFPRIPSDLPFPTGTSANWFCLKTPSNQDIPVNADAGQVCVDISPPDNEPDYVSIVWAQQINPTLYGNQFDIYEINTRRLSWMPVGQENGYDCQLWPSVAIHYGCVGDANLLESITYFSQVEGDPTHWIPGMTLFAPFTGTSSNAFHAILGNHPEMVISGIYNGSQVPFLYPGAASSISVSDSQNAGYGSYWAAWCPGLQMEPAPSQVFAAYGDTIN